MLPTLFISHGSPMHALDAGAAGKAWEALAASLPKPKAVMMVTAHWTTNLPMLSGNARPSMIYDFSGFPEPLYRIKYAAPGAPEIATRAQALLATASMPSAIDGCRGFDHGTWVPLLKIFPDADVPIVQLSVQPALGTSHHLHMGAALRSLREQDVLIIGSGHLTHNLRDWSMSANAPSRLDYASEFQSWVSTKLMSGDVEALAHYREQAPHAARAHPTEEHFLPLFVALGTAGEKFSATRVFDGFEGAALAMDAWRFDVV